MLGYRICRAAHRALDGEGARLYGGRWNSAGRAVIYLSGSRALAALELLVHLDSSEAPRDLVLIEVSFPDDSTDIVRPDSLPASWSRTPDHPACQARGDAWLDAAKQLALRVPAAPVAEEVNYLLNPAHPAFRRVRTRTQRRFTFDPRLIR
ncbi:MAG: RES family NAD+ phosphorylase [Gemmatimonadales bacterium]